MKADSEPTSLRRAALLALLCLGTPHPPLLAQGTVFTYQGRLSDDQNPANGSYDFRFTLFDTNVGGSLVGPIRTNSATSVSNGIFTVSLDFGAVFDGTGRWLEIGVRSNALDTFTTLNPRQALTPAPYAMLAGNVITGAITSAQLAPASVGSVALADSIALGDSSTLGQLDIYRTAVNTPAIRLFGSGSQISTYGSDGLEQIRLWGPAWGELLLFNSLPGNAQAVDLSANNADGGFLALRNTNAVTRAFLFGANSGGTLQLYDASSVEGVRLSSASASWLNGGSLGLGTINPAAALHVTGPSNTPPAGLPAPDNGLLLGSQGTTGYKWIQSYGGPLALNPVGNAIGIGTTNPVDCLLDIEGPTHINENDLYLRSGSDRNHGLGYRTTVGGIYIDGPFLYGFNGGALGVSQPDTASLTWNYFGDVGVASNLFAARMMVDRYGVNSGAVSPGITFGGAGEGIASKRTVGGNQYGLDFYTAFANRMTILNNGNVGIGLTSPQYLLHVGTTLGTNAINGSPVKVVVENSNAGSRATFLALAGPGASASSSRVEVQLEADVSQARGIFGTTSNHELQFRINNNEVMRLWTNGNVSIGGVTPTNKLHVAGGVSATAFVSTSDRSAKENFQPVSAGEVLAKVAALPISTWNYKDLHDGRHMGPMAQDFYAAFGLGGSDTTITSVDPDGVALAAIQGLNQKLEDQARALAAKDSRIAALERRLAELEKRTAMLSGNH